MARQNNKKNSKKLKEGVLNHEDDFNTGSHPPSSVRKVGAGYDDTGKGNDPLTSKSADKKEVAAKKGQRKNE
jgi:hypothetical protein